MTFTVVFWNIWLNTQVAGESNADARTLLRKLDEIIATYQPDCIGLNEVLQETDTKKLFVLEHLKQHGYAHQQFAYASPINEVWGIGLALVSRHPLKDVEEIVLGDDTFARWRGHIGYSVKALGARIELGADKSVNLMVAHPHALKPAGLPVHWQHQKSLQKAVAKPQYKQLILGGDFNEFNYMPMSFTRRENNRFYHRSGNFIHPTWTHFGHKYSFWRFNLDKIFWTKEPTTKLLEFKVLDNSPSDHAPLMARFTV